MEQDRPDGPGSTDDGGDPLTRLRAQLETVDEVAVPDRVALFEHANTTIANELAELDEV